MANANMVTLEWGNTPFDMKSPTGTLVEDLFKHMPFDLLHCYKQHTLPFGVDALAMKNRQLLIHKREAVSAAVKRAIDRNYTSRHSRGELYQGSTPDNPYPADVARMQPSDHGYGGGGGTGVATAGGHQTMHQAAALSILRNGRIANQGSGFMTQNQTPDPVGSATRSPARPEIFLNTPAAVPASSDALVNSLSGGLRGLNLSEVTDWLARSEQLPGSWLLKYHVQEVREDVLGFMFPCTAPVSSDESPSFSVRLTPDSLTIYQHIPREIINPVLFARSHGLSTDGGNGCFVAIGRAIDHATLHQRSIITETQNDVPWVAYTFQLPCAIRTDRHRVTYAECLTTDGWVFSGNIMLYATDRQTSTSGGGLHHAFQGQQGLIIPHRMPRIEQGDVDADASMMDFDDNTTISTRQQAAAMREAASLGSTAMSMQESRAPSHGSHRTPRPARKRSAQSVTKSVTGSTRTERAAGGSLVQSDIVETPPPHHTPNSTITTAYSVSGGRGGYGSAQSTLQSVNEHQPSVSSGRSRGRRPEHRSTHSVSGSSKKTGQSSRKDGRAAKKAAYSVDRSRNTAYASAYASAYQGTPAPPTPPPQQINFFPSPSGIIPTPQNQHGEDDSRKMAPKGPYFPPPGPDFDPDL